MFKKCTSTFTLVTAVSCLWPGSAFAVDYYSEEFIGGYGGFSINIFGDVCGRNNADDEGFALIDGVYLPLPTDGSCRGINDNLQMVFDRRDPITDEILSYLYEFEPASGTWVETAIPIVGGQGNVQARGINNAGQIVGWASDTSNFSRAFVWDRNSGTVLLGNLGAQSFAFDINEVGDIVGYATINGVARPFLYSTGGMQEITAVTCPRAIARGINDGGDIVGECNDGMGTVLPYIVSNGVFETIPGPNNDLGLLRAINNDGVAIGVAQNSLGGYETSVWDVDNGMRLLADLRLGQPGSSVSTALGINQAGQIIAGSTIFTPVLNVPPVLAAIGDKTIVEGAQLSFTLTASDLDGNLFAYTGSNVSPGAPGPDLGTLGNAMLDEVTGVFSWTPGFDQAGNYQIAFTVADAGTPVETDTEIINVTVGEVNRPPVVEPAGPFDVLVGEILTFQMFATDPDGGFVDITLASGPAGAEIGDGDFVYWVPDASQVGVHELVFDAADRAMPPAVTQVSVIVTVGQGELSPSELLDVILGEVDGLLSGPARAKLRKRVQIAQHLLSKNNIDGTLGSLNAFKAQVNNQLNKGEISAEEAQLLLDLADELIALLESLQNP